MTSAHPATRLPLAELQVGTLARLAEIRGGRRLSHRLLALGLRIGSEIEVLHHRGSGLVVSHGETRVALGGGIVDKLWVARLTRPSASDEI